MSQIHEQFSEAPQEVGASFAGVQHKRKRYRFHESQMDEANLTAAATSRASFAGFQHKRKLQLVLS